MGVGFRPWLETPSEADFGCVIEHSVAGAEIGEVGVGHGEALIANIEVESRLDGVGEASCKLPCKVPLVGGIGTDFGKGSA